MDLVPYRAAADRPFVDVLPEDSVDGDAQESAIAEQLLKQTCACYLVTPTDLRRPGRSPRHLLAARHALMQALQQLGWNYVRIGKFVGRDRTTVMFALGAVHKGQRRPR